MSEEADKVIPIKERRGKQKWMNEPILEKKSRRRLKKNKTPEYIVIDIEIKQDCSLGQR